MDCIAVDDDWGPLLGGCVAKTFNEDKNGWSLLVLEASIVRQNDEVPDYRILWNFLGVQRSNDAVGMGNYVPSLSHEL